MSTSPLTLSLGNAAPTAFERYDTASPHATTVLVVLPHGAVVDVSYGYPLSFNRAVECALAIHAPAEWHCPGRRDFNPTGPLSTGG